MLAPRVPTLRRGITGGLALCALVAASIRPRVGAAEAAIRRLPRATRGADAARYTAFITEAANRFGLPASWIRAVIATESGGDRFAVSPAGALGLMQIMPATWQFERARLALGADPFSARDNILAGSDYLRAMRDRYGTAGMLAAYNAGPGRYDAYRRGESRLPAETLAYLERLAPVLAGSRLNALPAKRLANPIAWAGAPLFVTRSSIKPTSVSIAKAVSRVAPTNGDSGRIFAAERPVDNNNRAAAEGAFAGVFVPLDGDRS